MGNVIESFTLFTPHTFDMREKGSYEVSGIVAPWNKFTRGNYRMRFRRDAFKVGSMPIPLLEGHDENRFNVGLSTKAESRRNGLWMSFKIANTDRGREAVQLLDDRMLIGFSVGLNSAEYLQGEDEHGIYEDIDKALLVHVGLTSMPRFESTLVDRTRQRAASFSSPVSNRNTYRERLEALRRKGGT